MISIWFNYKRGSAVSKKLVWKARLNIVISGGTGSGKTHFLNVLSRLYSWR